MRIIEKIDDYLTEAKASKVDFECLECGKKFSKSSKGFATGDIRCPKCRGVDIEPV